MLAQGYPDNIPHFPVKVLSLRNILKDKERGLFPYFWLQEEMHT